MLSYTNCDECNTGAGVILLLGTLADTVSSGAGNDTITTTTGGFK